MSTNASGRQANLPIWRDANRLLVEVEQAVWHFGKTPSPPQYHKYALGTDLSRQAMTVCRCIGPHRCHWRCTDDTDRTVSRQEKS